MEGDCQHAAYKSPQMNPREPRAEPELPEAKDNEVLYTPES